MRRITRLAGMVVILAVVLAACNPSSGASFLIGDSDLLIPQDHPAVTWLDNSTLFFEGSPEDAIHAGFRPSSRHLYTWKIDGKPQLFRAETWPPKIVDKNPYPIYYICASEGAVHYAVRPGLFPDASNSHLRLPIMVGSPGREVLKIETLYADVSEEARLFTSRTVGARCDSYSRDNPPKGMAGRVWNISYKRDLVLDFGPVVRGPTIYRASPKLFIWPTLLPIPLKMSVGQARPSCTLTPSWEDAFVVWDCPSGDVTKLLIAEFPVWKIKRDGSVERLLLHLGNLQITDLIPIPDGYVATISGTKDFKGPGLNPAAGIYRIQDGELRQVMKGFYWLQSLSPNGCLGAFGELVRQGGIVDSLRLKAVDLCKLARG